MPYVFVVPLVERGEINLHRAVFLVNLEQGNRGVELAVKPFAFPADFVVVAHHGFQITLVDVFGVVGFENAGVAGIHALAGRDVVSDAEIRHKAVFAAHAVFIFIGIGAIVPPIVIGYAIGFPLRVARACDDVQVV